jgi:hypothetical protein
MIERRDLLDGRTRPIGIEPGLYWRFPVVSAHKGGGTFARQGGE